MNVAVSVIIPTYRRPVELKRAVLSVLKQSFSDFEILVVNDHFEDKEIVEVIDSLNDARIKLFKNIRVKGANGARNTGILNAKGYYIGFLDDDDEWLPDKLGNQVKCLKGKNESFGGVYSSYLIERNNRWEKYSGMKEGDLLSEILLDSVEFCAGSNLLIRSDVMEEIGLWDEELLRQQDLEFLVRFLNKYHLAFDNNIAAKIYGHNTPNPLKSFEEREKYLVKIYDYLKKLSEADRNNFYSDHFRRQTIFLLKLKEFTKAKRYWKKGRSYKLISLRKDLKILLLFFESNIT